MIPVIPGFVHEFAYLPHLTLNPLQRRHLEQYLTALMICDDHTMAVTDDSGLEPQVSDSVEFLLSEYPWEDQLTENVRGFLIQEATRKEGVESGVLIIESSLVEPAVPPGGESTGGEKQSLATSRYACESFHVPLDFETFRGKKRTPEWDPEEKTSTFKALFTKAVKRDLPLSMVWMDDWFFCPETVDFLEKSQHFPYIAAVDKDFQVVIHNQARTLSEYAASLPWEAYKLEELATSPKSRSVYRYVSVVVHLASAGQVRLVIAYRLAPGAEGPRFLVTNQLDWGIEKILWKYSQPWFVEHLWSEGLNPLGIGRGGLEATLGMEWQIRMSFLAETLFQLNAQMGSFFRPGGESNGYYGNVTNSSNVFDGTV
jgi:hypothetical protein